MKTTVRNGKVISPCADLAEIEIFGTQAFSDVSLTLGMISRFDAVRVLDPEWSWQVTVRLKRAFVKLNSRGCEVSREGRAGDTPRPQQGSASISSKVNVEKINASSLDVGASADTSTLSPSLKARVKAGLQRNHNSHESRSTEVKSDLRSEALQAVSGNRWIIKDVQLPYLTGRYSPEDDFCLVDLSAAAGNIRASLYFLPSDMVLAYERAEGAPLIDLRARPNAIAVVKALIAKNLRSLNTKVDQDGYVYIGSSNVSFDRSER